MAKTEMFLWENHGEIMGKSWRNHGEIWDNHGKIIGQRWEKHATILGKSLGKVCKHHEKDMGTSPIDDVDSWENNLCMVGFPASHV